MIIQTGMRTDIPAFCTKNPAPMLLHMDVLKPYGQYWFVTMTPYGKDIEPNVPDKAKVMENFRKLSNIVGVDSVGWRYDPIFVDEKHSVKWHIAEFEKMAATLSGYTKTCVISFIDIYKKAERNMPEARAVSGNDRITIGMAGVIICDNISCTEFACKIAGSRYNGLPFMPLMFKIKPSKHRRRFLWIKKRQEH